MPVDRYCGSCCAGRFFFWGFFLYTWCEIPSPEQSAFSFPASSVEGYTVYVMRDTQPSEYLKAYFLFYAGHCLVGGMRKDVDESTLFPIQRYNYLSLNAPIMPGYPLIYRFK